MGSTEITTQNEHSGKLLVLRCPKFPDILELHRLRRPPQQAVGLVRCTTFPGTSTSVDRQFQGPDSVFPEEYLIRQRALC